MRLFLMHFDDEPVCPGSPPRTTPSEEATIIVPGAATKTAIAVPVVALERFLPTLAEATKGLEQPCPCCGESLGTVPPRWLGRG